MVREQRLEQVREVRRRLARDGTRLRALRLPDPPFEPAFEHFQPF